MSGGTVQIGWRGSGFAEAGEDALIGRALVVWVALLLAEIVPGTLRDLYLNAVWGFQGAAGVDWDHLFAGSVDAGGDGLGGADGGV